MNEQILSELKDVHLPPEPSVWPLAGGYYIAFLLMVGILLGLFWWLRRQAKKRKFRRKWHAELHGIAQRFDETKNVSQLQTDLSWLVRRLAYESSPNKNAEFKIRELGPSLGQVFGAGPKVDSLLVLLSEDRFKATNNVDGTKLLAVFKELSKSCRI
jgi:hypothetical protein